MKKKILSLIVAVTVFIAQYGLISVCLPKVSAETTGGICGDNATWTLDTDTKTLYIEGFGTMYDYSARNAPWNEYSYFIKNVVFSEGITHIGGSSFYDIYFDKVTIPSTVETIGGYAFGSYGNVKEFDISENIRLREAPDFIKSLKKLTWYNNVPDGPVYFANLLCGYKGEMPENYCLEVKEGTYSINTEAFLNQSNLVDIVLPDSVIHMGRDALKNTGWYNAQSDGAVYVGKILYEYRGKPTIDDKDFTVAEGTISIAPGAFAYKPYISAVHFPSTVKAIGERAFIVVNTLETVDFKEGCALEYIGKCAFESCQMLSTFDFEGIDEFLPESLIHIGENAFRFTSRLKKTINIPDNFNYIGESAFASGGVVAYDVAENNKYYSIDEHNILYNKNKTVLIAAPVTFENKEVVLPETVKEIRSYAFEKSSVNKITLPDGVTDLGECTFRYSALKEINIPDGVTVLKEFVFASSMIKELTLPSSVTTIESNAFQWTPIRKIVIPKETVNIVGNPFKKSNSSAPPLTVYCYENSAAHNTAVEYGIDFVLLDKLTFNGITNALERAKSIDRSLYTDESLAELDFIIDSVDVNSTSVTQIQLDEWEEAINDAIEKLEYKSADYTAVNDAINKAEGIDRSLYTEESLAKLDEAVDAVDKTLNITNQSAVQKYADAITDAIGKLEYKPADYTAVNDAINKAEGIDRSLYTEESLAKLDEAVDAVDRTLNITNQSAVQKYADAITDAIGKLEYKHADYTAVNDAINKAEVIDRSLYTEESLAKLDEAVAAVDKTLNITNQSSVQKYADAITDAIGKLEYKPADYTAVNEAINKAEVIDRSLYTEESLAKLDEAVDAVDRTLNITNQSAVQKYADAITDAIEKLEYKSADYTAVYNAVEKANSVNRILYSNASLMILEQSIDAVDYSLNITQQSIVDGFADRIMNSIAELKYADVVLRDEPNGVVVSATAKEIYPTTSLTVDILDPSNYETADFAVGGYIKSIQYYDINLIREGAKVQPDGTVYVKIRIPDGVKPEKCRVYHVTEDPVDPLVRFASTLDGNYIVFETDHFSEFAVIEVETYLSGITVTKMPSKLTYAINEKLDLSDMEITALYSDGKTEIISNYDVSNVDTSSIGIKTVTVYHTFGEITKSTSFEITVSADDFVADITCDGNSINEYNKKIKWYKGYSTESLQLACNIPDSGKYSVEWKSDNSKVFVDENGKVTNKGFFFPRKATITVTVTDSAGNIIATDSVVVRFYKFDFQFSGIQNVFGLLRRNSILFF